ncbi:hypothetical protein EW093_05995 [Thiospirochaeta perfilievii]|uniref:GGDEF domain-containing protein n=1 Tax=Thiospirochaeta perfilievii TaxID=252967 RepID=A0A5C1QBM2_9SPIO|nr:hypothetical protein [Thiospirochaeta perfilievii]QEN04269.1 hypothetical protein EW093_05995 [Thiospirochaeta perfilievii]
MGLLQKASEHNLNSPQQREINFLQLKEGLTNIKKTIDFYPNLFKSLTKLLSIEKGALLIKEGDIFSLSSIIGFDETTKNRLRISTIEFDNYMESGNIDIFQKYLSIREFVTTKQVLLYPLFNKENPKALLLITEFKIEKAPERNEIQFYLSEIAKISQDNPIDRMQGTVLHSNNVKSSVRSYLQTVKNSENRVIFIKLNLSNLLLKFKEDDSLSTESSITNGALKMLTSFTKNRGRVFQLYNNDILLTLLDKKNSINIMVVQQQIDAAFKTVYSNRLSSVNFNYESLIWNNNSLDTILDHFIQDDIN